MGLELMREVDIANLVTKKEAAIFLRVSIFTIDQWVSKKKLRVLKAGSRTLIERAELQRFLLGGE